MPEQPRKPLPPAPLFGPGWREINSRSWLSVIVVVLAVGAAGFAVERSSTWQGVLPLALLSLQVAMVPLLVLSRFVQRWQEPLQRPGGSALCWFCRAADGRPGLLEADRAGHLRFVPLKLRVALNPGPIVLWCLLMGPAALVIALAWRVAGRLPAEELLAGKVADDCAVGPPPRLLPWLLIGQRPLLVFAGGEQVELSLVGAERVCAHVQAGIAWRDGG